jgi:membrane-associated protease RseP (regulator of RpoE activity)
LFRFATSRALPLFFFLLTVASTLYVGGYHGLGFWAPERLAEGSVSLQDWLFYGFPFSFTILAIIGTHEMGHYLTAKRYRLDTSLPVFLPFPISLIGTLGAFILIKSPFPNRRSLIDVGLAGPFAGFVVCLPALLIGVATSRPSIETSSEGIGLGLPLLFQGAVKLLWPDLPDDQNFLVSPIGLAAWFGLLLTAINLLPIGQLDGGHATYALFREKAHRLSTIFFFALLLLAILTPSWLFFALLTYAIGIRRPHPPTLFDDEPLPRSRFVMGLLALVTFALCFTPKPLQISWSDFLGAFRELF